MSISIGVNQHMDTEESKTTGVGDDDDDDLLDTIDEMKVSPTPNKTSEVSPSPMKQKQKQKDNIMDTNWGNDVFEIINDEDEDDDDDDDDDEEEEEVSITKGDLNLINQTKDNTNSNEKEKLAAINKLMSKEEEELRVKRFEKSAHHSHNIAVKTATASSNTTKSLDSSKSSTQSNISSDTIASLPVVVPPSKLPAIITNTEDTKVIGKKNSMRVAIVDETENPNSATHRNSDISKCSTPALYLQNGKKKYAHSFNCEIGDNEDADVMSMDDFSALMDTLTLQPKRGKFEEDVDTDSSQDSDDNDDSHTISSRLIDADYHNIYNNILITSDSEIGIRENQEDRFVIVKDVSTLFSSNKQIESKVTDQLRHISFAAIFDGHSGDSSSEFLSQNIVSTIFKDPFFFQNVDNTLQSSFKILDEVLLEKLSDDEDTSGSTAICAIYNGISKLLTVAVVGDSMCVLSCHKKARILTKMHRLDNTSERNRIEKANGIIINSRVNGILAVTRAFGDSQFKSTSNGTPSKTVISEPEIFVEPITTTEFAIFASDGLWDVMSAQAAVNFIWKQKSKKIELNLIPSLLVKHAIIKGSIDNVTAVIIWFNISTNSTR